MGSGTRVERQEDRSQLGILLQAARQPRQCQTKEAEIALVRVLLQCGFVVSHSPACCAPVGVRTCAIVEHPG